MGEDEQTPAALQRRLQLGETRLCIARVHRSRTHLFPCGRHGLLCLVRAVSQRVGVAAVLTTTAIAAARPIGNRIATAEAESPPLRNLSVGPLQRENHQPLHPNTPVRNGLAVRSRPTVVVGP